MSMVNENEEGHPRGPAGMVTREEGAVHGQ